MEGINPSKEAREEYVQQFDRRPEMKNPGERPSATHVNYPMKAIVSKSSPIFE